MTEKKILIGIVIIGIALLMGIGGLTYILLTREPVVIPTEKEEALEDEIIEPPPLEEDALLEATKLVGERLRVFDVEERQDLILFAIRKNFTSGMSNTEKKAVVESVVNTEMTTWKDQVIRDTLIELHGEYSSEDYSAIDRKTNIKQLKEFVTLFEMEVLGIK